MLQGSLYHMADETRNLLYPIFRFQKWKLSYLKASRLVYLIFIDLTSIDFMRVYELKAKKKQVI